MKYKYKVDTTSDFKKDYKRIIRQGKKIEKIKTVIDTLACGEELDKKYKDHKLNNNKRYVDCRELHIEPDCLLVYRIMKDELILLLIDTGTHSDLF